MATVTVRLPDEKHERLKLMAKRYGISSTSFSKSCRPLLLRSSTSRRGFGCGLVVGQ